MSTFAPLGSALIPRHIAIIMDGNNRYGKANALGSGGGHMAGKEALDPIVEYCREVGIEVLTVFAFSSENWQRPPNEVALLMRLLELTIHEQLPRMQKHHIRLRFIGDRSQLTGDLRALMADAEAQTAQFDAMTLVIAISYGGSGILLTLPSNWRSRWKRGSYVLMILMSSALLSMYSWPTHQRWIC